MIKAPSIGEIDFHSIALSVRCVRSAKLSITERNVDIARGLHQLAVRRDKL